MISLLLNLQIPPRYFRDSQANRMLRVAEDLKQFMGFFSTISTLYPTNFLYTSSMLYSLSFSLLVSSENSPSSRLPVQRYPCLQLKRYQSLLSNQKQVITSSIRSQTEVVHQTQNTFWVGKSMTMGTFFMFMIISASKADTPQTRGLENVFRRRQKMQVKYRGLDWMLLMQQLRRGRWRRRGGLTMAAARANTLMQVPKRCPFSCLRICMYPSSITSSGRERRRLIWVAAITHLEASIRNQSYCRRLSNSSMAVQ